jgi:hypothetical protein
MNFSLHVDLRQVALRDAAALVLGSSNRAGLNAAMATAVRDRTRDYLRAQDRSRGSIGDPLAATQGNLAGPAWRAVQDAPIEANANAGWFTVDHPEIARAFGDVTFEEDQSTAAAGAPAFSKSGGVIRGSMRGSVGTALRPAHSLLAWLQVRTITARQDRALLPSDEDWQAAAAQAARLWYAQRLAPSDGGQAAAGSNLD